MGVIIDIVKIVEGLRDQDRSLVAIPGGGRVYRDLQALRQKQEEKKKGGGPPKKEEPKLSRRPVAHVEREVSKRHLPKTDIEEIPRQELRAPKLETKPEPEVEPKPEPEVEVAVKRALRPKRRFRRREREEKKETEKKERARGKPEIPLKKPKRAIDDETKKLPKRKKTPSPVASAEERTEDATRQREKKRGKMERGVEEASKKAAARRTQERYQTIGATSKKFAQVVRKSISTMEEYKDIYKSKSYLAPVVSQVLNRRISLKEALDKVPWYMQAELLEQLHKRA